MRLFIRFFSISVATTAIFLGLLSGDVWSTGPITSEGDWILNADFARDIFSVDGEGVRIGVLADGVTTGGEQVFYNFQLDRASDELPQVVALESLLDTSGAQLLVLKNGPNDPARNKAEGTAMLEIIHDIAPKADLLFYSAASGDYPFGESGLADGINALAANGCDIIVDDMGFFDQPFFQENAGMNIQIRQAVNNFVNSGGIYFSAVGNYADGHYESNFSDVDNDNLHEFSGGDESLDFSIPAGESIRFYIQWSDEWNNPSSNFQARLFEGTTKIGEYNRHVENVSGNTTAFPFIFFSFENTNGFFGKDISLKLVNTGSPSTGLRIKIYWDDPQRLIDKSEIVPDGSAYGHPLFDNVVAVGGISAQASLDVVVDFSSHGPSRLYTDLSQNIYETRSKPDIVAPLEVHVSGAFGFGTDDGANGNIFRGTSAAAPHAAAVAGLVLSGTPSLTGDQLRTILQNTAEQFGGYNYNYSWEHPGMSKKAGHGRINALHALSIGRKELEAYAHTEQFIRCYTHDDVKDPAKNPGKPVEYVYSNWPAYGYDTQRFENGTIFYDTSGQQAYFLGDGIFEKWIELGDGNSSLGLPISNEFEDYGNNNNPTVLFQHGKIFWDGANAQYQVYESETGDFNHSGTVDLADLIAVLQVTAGVNTRVFLDVDPDNNGRIGLPDAIYLLQKISNVDSFGKPVVTATPGDGVAILEWSPVPQAVSYNLYKAPGFMTNTWSMVAENVTDCTYTIGNLINGTDYTFAVAAIDWMGGESQWAIVSVRPDGPLPEPTVTETVSGDGQVEISWHPMNGAVSFSVYVYSCNLFGFCNWYKQEGDITDLSYVFSGLVNGITYPLGVVAVDENGVEGDMAQTVGTPAAPPSIPTITSAVGGDGQAELTWNPVSGAVSYNVYKYACNPFCGFKKHDEDIVDPSYVFTGLTNGTSYQLGVTAVNVNGVESDRAQVTVTPVGSITAPTITGAIEGDGQVELTWNPVSGAVSYNVYKYYCNLFCNWIKQEGNIFDQSYVFTNLTNGTSYRLGVAAVNAVGQESEITEVSAVPQGSSPDSFTNSLGMTFVRIPAGTFMMGSPPDELGRDTDETQHEVTLTKDFYMMTTEVTQSQWEMIMGSNPSYFGSCGGNCPVENVSWNDAQEFINALNSVEPANYRLPTEAEWEFAARANSTTAFSNGIISEEACGYEPNLTLLGWYCGNSIDKTHPVAQKEANSWGLFDMHGNVYEWCQDWYGSYPLSAVFNPTGPSSGTRRVLRGGSWRRWARLSRSANRGYDPQAERLNDNGIRLVAEINDTVPQSLQTLGPQL